MFYSFLVEEDRQIWKEIGKQSSAESDSSDLRNPFWTSIYLGNYLITPLTIKGTLDETTRLTDLWVYTIHSHVQLGDFS